MARLGGVVVVVVVLATVCVAEEEAVRVNELGVPERLAVCGSVAFSEAEIRDALFTDIDIVAAARPYAPLETLQQLLVDKTLAGYRRHGFGDVKAEVVCDAGAGKLRLNLQEGACYVAGEIEIHGTKSIDAARLIQDLTPADVAREDRRSAGVAQQYSKKGLCWPIGRPAWFDREAQSSLRDRIDALLYDYGYLFAGYSLEVIRDEARRTAKLKIEFSNEGKVATLDEVTVIDNGNEKHWRQEILDFLEVKKGMRWTGTMSERMERRLKESGRFVKASVRAPKPATPERWVWLWINAKEYKPAPPLAQPLSRDEQALVKLSQWLRNFGESDEELEFTLDAARYACRVVISPKRGILATVTDVKARQTDAKPPPFHWAWVSSEERIGLYSVPRSQKIVAVPIPAPVIARASASLHDGPPSLRGEPLWYLGMGMNSQTKRGRRRHCEFQFTDSPVSLLSLAHEYGSEIVWDDDMVTVRYKQQRLKFDGRTGRLVEFASESKPFPYRVVIEQGAFQRTLDIVDSVTAEFPDAAHPPTEQPLSSVLEFVAEELLTQDDDAFLRNLRGELGLLRKMVALGLSKPIDRLFRIACRPERQRFTIPVEGGDFSVSFPDGDFNGTGGPTKTISRLAACFGISAGNLLFPEQSWPRSFSRELALLHAAKAPPRECAAELLKLAAARDTGPLCCLSVAMVARLLPLELNPGALAGIGAIKLSLAAFRRDYAPLIDESSLVGECVLAIAETIRGLDKDEMDALIKILGEFELLDEHVGKLIAAVAFDLRHYRDEPIATALPKALDDNWNSGLREQVKLCLEFLAAEASADRQEESLGAEPQLEEQAAPGAARTRPANPSLVLDGYCAVTLLKSRRWVRGDANYGVIYRDRLYLFADESRQEAFISHPNRFAVVNQGNDLVEQVDHGRIVEGKRDFGVFCDGKIFLFASETSRDKFERRSKRYLRVAMRLEAAPSGAPRAYREAEEKGTHSAKDSGSVGERIARHALHQRLLRRRLR